jgi:hypothetical protein
MANQRFDTSKYGSVASAAKTKVDPPLQPQTVAGLYAAFGRTPTRTDMTYWTQLPSSKRTALLNELRKPPEQDGKGGTADATAGAPTGTTVSPGSDYMMGNTALFRFTTDPNGADLGDEKTIWLYDKTDDTLRPFLSEEAFNNYYGSNAKTNWGKVKVVGADMFQKGRQLEKAATLGPDYAIQSSGLARNLGFSPKNLADNWGKAKNEDKEQESMLLLKNALKMFKSNKASRLGSQFVDSVMNDPTLLEFYNKAQVYGNYSLGSVWQDLITRQEGSLGNINFANNIKPISDTMTSNEYKNTTAYVNSVKMTEVLQEPLAIGDISGDMLTYGLHDLPPEYFKVLAPTIDVKSPEFQKQMDSIQSYAHDLAEAALTADNDSTRQAAQGAWKEFNRQLDKAYGWKLSDNAVAATTALDKIRQEYITAGRAGGEERSAEVIQSIQSSKADQRLRDTEKMQLDDKAKEYFTTNATMEELAAVEAEDVAKGIPLGQRRIDQWGKREDPAFVKAWSYEELKKKYPDTNDTVLRQTAEAMADKSGIRFSSNEKTYRENMMKVATGLTPTTAPKTSRIQDAVNRVTEVNQNKAQQKYDEVSGLTPPTAPMTTPPQLSAQDQAKETASMAQKVASGMNPTATLPTAPPVAPPVKKPLTPTEWANLRKTEGDKAAAAKTTPATKTNKDIYYK